MALCHEKRDHVARALELGLRDRKLHCGLESGSSILLGQLGAFASSSQQPSVICIYDVYMWLAYVNVYSEAHYMHTV